MSAAPTDLPDDIEALKAMVASLREQLSSRAIEIEHLQLTIAKLRRMQFGRKSEKLGRQIGQLELRLEDLQADEGAADVAAAPEAKRPRREGASRKPLPEHLEREERVHLPADDDWPDCGGQLKPLGEEDVAEQLEYVRAHFRVIRHRRPKLARARCDRIVQAAAPSRPLDRGIPGPALLAHIAVSKFAYHLPLHRQAVMYARDGVEIDPGAMGYWMGSITALLAPLVDAMRRYTLACGKVHADDTPLPVLAPGNGRTKTGRLWVYVRDDRQSGSDEPPAAWFAYTSDRRGEHPQRHLADFAGVLQADAFAGYAELHLDSRVQEAACMAHARRKIHDLHAVRPNDVTKAGRRAQPADETLPPAIWRGQLDTLGKSVDRINNAIARLDYGAVAGELHSIKSALALVCETAIVQWCERIEFISREGRLPAVDEINALAATARGAPVRRVRELHRAKTSASHSLDHILERLSRRPAESYASGATCAGIGRHVDAGTATTV